MSTADSPDDIDQIPHATTWAAPSKRIEDTSYDENAWIESDRYHDVFIHAYQGSSPFLEEQAARLVGYLDWTQYDVYVSYGVAKRNRSVRWKVEHDRELIHLFVDEWIAPDDLESKIDEAADWLTAFFLDDDEYDGPLPDLGPMYDQSYYGGDPGRGWSR